MEPSGSDEAANGPSPPAGVRRWTVGLGRLAWGTVLLVAPDRVALAMGAGDRPAARRLARVLGARHVLQAAVELAAWPRFRRLGVAVDAAHALSGLAAALDRRWRRPALTDAAVACGFAAAGMPAPAAGSRRPGGTATPGWRRPG